MAPGESANHGCLVPSAGVLTALAARGGATYESGNEGWLVVVDSKTKRWHRYKVLCAWPVPNGPTAGSIRDGVVAHLTNGDDVAMIDTWPDWPKPA